MRDKLKQLRGKLHLPYLHLYLNIPFFSMETQVLRRAYDRDSFDYIRLRVMLWKWHWSFALYQPGVYAAVKRRNYESKQK